MTNKFDKKGYLEYLAEENKKLVFSERLRQAQDDKIYNDPKLTEQKEGFEKRAFEIEQNQIRERNQEKPNLTLLKKMEHDLDNLAHEKQIFYASVMQGVLEGEGKEL